MAVACNRNHEHLPWSIDKIRGQWHFATASEAEYPQELCSAITKIVVARANISFEQVWQHPKKKPKLRSAQAG